MLRIIRECRPDAVVGENVSGILSWSGGLVFDEVQVDLEVEGYDVQAVVLPACAVGAPHRRDRVWFVANSRGEPVTSGVGNKRGREGGIEEPEGGQIRNNPVPDGEPRVVVHPKGVGHNIRKGTGGLGGRKRVPREPVEDAAIRGQLGGLGQLPPVADTPGEGHEKRIKAIFREGIPEDGTGMVAEPERPCGGKLITNPDQLDGYPAGLHPGGLPFIEKAGILENIHATVPFASAALGVGSKGDWTQGQQEQRPPLGKGLSGRRDSGGVRNHWDNFPTEWPLRDGDDGLSAILGGGGVRVAGKKVTASSVNKFTLKGGGNAVVPPLVVQVFRALEDSWEGH